MPVSNPDHLPSLIHLLGHLQPRRLLDVGIGMGSLGLLARQSLDICYGRIDPSAWQTAIEGVEIFENYRNPVWSYAYSKVHSGDIRTLLPSLGHYDVIVCCDVLEHFTTEDADKLIKALLAQGTTLIATTPNHLIPQDAWAGNEAERHLSVITATNFPGLALHRRGAITDLFAASLDPQKREQIRAAGRIIPHTVVPQPPSIFHRLIRKLRALRR